MSYDEILYINVLCLSVCLLGLIGKKLNKMACVNASSRTYAEKVWDRGCVQDKDV